MQRMDAIQPNHRPLRPMIDPHLHQPPPAQQSAGWYSGQFQYQSAAPPHQQQQHQWAPAPPDQYGQGFNPPQEMYHHQPQQGQHYPHPPAPQPPRPMPPPQVTHMYAQPDQAWTNPGWSHQQPWEYAGNNSAGVSNEEDWAAKARAWAAAKAAMEAQQAQSQFAPSNRSAEHHVYQGHYTQSVQPPYPEVQQPSLPAMGQQPVHPSAVSVPNIATNQVQDTSSHFPSDVSSSYISDGYMSYGSKDAALTHEQNALAMSSQGSLPPITTSYSQEMPISYTSIPGVEDQAKQRQISSSPLSSPMTVQHDEHVSQAQLQSTLTSQSSHQPHFTYSEQQALPVPEVGQQSDFEHVGQDYLQHQQSSYLAPVQTMAIDGQEYNGPLPSVSGWSQFGGPNAPFSPVPPIASSHQFENPYISLPHPIHGHPPPLFGRVPGPQPGPGFRPNMPPIVGPFGIGPGSPGLPPGPVGMVGPPFMGDNNGAFGVPERPKKASLPNWLREEVMKKKAAVVANSSAQGLASEDSFRASGPEDGNYPFQKAEIAASKSVDSQRTSDDEDDDEYEVEVARTAAINKEIKRVLTDVLFKVTDDLFDEIAQEVLDEDDNSTQVKKPAGNDWGRTKTFSKASSPPLQVQPPTLPARVVVSANNATFGIKDDDGDDNSSSSAHGGNVLGLVNYASDDDNDSVDRTQQQITSQVSEQQDGGLLEENANIERLVGHLRPDEANITEKMGGEKSRDDQQTDVDDDNDNRRIKEQPKDTLVSKELKGTGEEHEKFKVMSKTYASKSVDKGTERSQVTLKNAHDEVECDKRRSDDSKDKEGIKKIDKSDMKRSASVLKTDHGEMKSRKGDNKQHDSVQHRKDVEKGRERERERDREKIKESEKNRAMDKKRDKERIRDREGRKDSDRTYEKERRKDYEKEKKVIDKHDDRKRNEKDKGERNGIEKHRDTKDTGKRRKRSSSVSSRGRNSKVDSYDSNNSSSAPEVTESTRPRKLHSTRHSPSLSPIKSRKRQVSRSRSRSRSPHARHSHRRHSPYPSHEGRRKQSRSGSPVRRRRRS